MSDEIKDFGKAFISYLDEQNNNREGYFEIIHFDSSFVKFKTHKNILVIPTARILKIKYNLEDEK